MIEFATSVMLLASAFAPAKADAATATTTVNPVSSIPLVATTTQLDIRSTEEYVRAYFQDEPILAEIAKCESSFRQYDKSGNVLRGRVNAGDIGVMQINKYYHEEDAQKLGFDIYTLQGNLEFAKVLYGKYGDKPWSSSSKCWMNQRFESAAIAKA